MPRHSWTFDNTQPVANIILNIFEIKNARIVVILSGEERCGEICRMYVCKWVRLGIPSPETEIEPADTGAVVVHNYKLTVMQGANVILLHRTLTDLNSHDIPSRDATRIQHHLRV